MTRYFLPIIIILASLLASCQDDLRFNPLGEGEATITATVKFHPLVGSTVSDGESRTPGDAIHHIRNIQVVIYKSNGELLRVERFGEGYSKTFTPGTQDKMPSDSELADADQSEASTETAEFVINDLPYGRYKIYVVANYATLDEENIPTPEALMNHKATWSEENVSYNDQMFGHLSTDDFSEKDAPDLEIGKETVPLTGWIKRLASKLTIVYDGTGLKEGINIYIQKVSVRDIPRECVLGFNESQLTEEQKGHGINGNAPSAKSQLIDNPAHGTLWYSTIKRSESTGTVDSIATLETDPGLSYSDWMHITKSTTALGAVATDGNKLVYKEVDGKKELVAHTENMQSLYFYENCQGNYPGDEAYNKEPKPDDVGKDEKTEGIYKDKVPLGTYIEVEGYYVSTNPDNQSSGPIKYRFMLGQNETFNYNALRNRHYKLWLKFKGYANQPEWHIVYDEEEPGLYPLPQYNVSYMYNIRHEMPIRLTGMPYKVTLQIIENNWAPYDPTQPDSVPPATVETDDPNRPFRWYKASYDQQDIPFKNDNGNNMTNAQISALSAGVRAEYSPKPVTNYWISGYYYGKHKRSAYNSRMPYTPAIPGSDDEITPIWVGFLALQVPAAYDDYNVILPTGIQNTPKFNDNGVNIGDNYTSNTTIAGLRDYYNGNGGEDTEHRSNRGVKLYECTYEFNTLPAINDSIQVASGQGGSLTGRNAANLKNNGDNTYTIKVPFFTMPKDIGYITGFSGNNPYEAYKRRAKVLITAYYKVGDSNVKIVRRVPVYQQQRIVNPKGVWRTGNTKYSTQPFHVRLMELPGAAATKFQQIESEGDWAAWVATPIDESTPNKSSFIFLTGGTSVKDGVVYGSTGSLVDFTINFRGTTAGSQCAKVIVRYHNKTCEHAIFVRQGYDVPLALVDGGAKWSSYAVYAFNGSTLDNAISDLPSDNQDMLAEMTCNPLALGTMFKRGNYGQGIRITNNKTYPVMVPIGTDGKGPLDLISIDDAGNHVESTGKWPDILGIQTFNDACKKWRWSNFHSQIASGKKFNYDLPTYDDFNVLTAQDFGIGVLYADGATETQELVDDAYKYFNSGNTLDMEHSEYGMRGIMIYNKKDFNQIFFPIGYSGVGRRTVQNTPNTAANGYLRYGALYYPLSTGANWNNGSNSYANALRPVAYNLPANPGAQYWMKTIPNGTTNAAWDFNYFDLNFSAYDASVGNTNATNADDLNYGDALPIKPIVKD